jgi:hypothetical protein
MIILSTILYFLTLLQSECQVVYNQLQGDEMDGPCIDGQASTLQATHVSVGDVQIDGFDKFTVNGWFRVVLCSLIIGGSNDCDLQQPRVHCLEQSESE